jgi:hypothetical protein
MRVENKNSAGKWPPKDSSNEFETSHSPLRISFEKICPAKAQSAAAFLKNVFAPFAPLRGKY